MLYRGGSAGIGGEGWCTGRCDGSPRPAGRWSKEEGDGHSSARQGEATRRRRVSTLRARAATVCGRRRDGRGRSIADGCEPNGAKLLTTNEVSTEWRESAGVF